MKKTLNGGRVSAGLVALAALAGTSVANPDVIVGDLPSAVHYGAVGGMRSYAVGTTSCNIGTTPLLWQANNPNHPVIGQNMYRVWNGRIDNIGISWLKHGFTALTQNLCGSCQNPGTGSLLGVNCSDPYGASLNGSQGGLGPRFQVNAYTGVFNYPWANPQGSTGNAIFKRCQVPEVDLTAANYPGALYFFEGHYVTPDDAQAGNGGNNASYRRFRVNADFTLTAQGTTQRQKAAIWAWKDNGLGIGVPDPDVDITTHFAPSDGRYHVGRKVKDNGDGTWTYTYAIQNLDSDRSGASVVIPLGNGASASDNYFRAPHYHSGEPYDNTPWAYTNSGSSVSWGNPVPWTNNPNGNALRWGTLYTFQFVSDGAPVAGNMTLNLFKPGPGGTSISIPTLVPGDVKVPCLADWNGDGNVDFFDAQLFLGDFSANNPAADLNGDGNIDFFDAAIFLQAFSDGCP
ncbi:MAG: hypothetical protein KF757_05965 [Phycisphaeraceae bacterium]|nr:hypothetical protein [Phycisphaeraceae bacterium]MCW5763719.1 hypothetical protein [Phycisphaeraceae bacterium]